MDYQFENVQYYNQKMYLEFNYKIYCRPALFWGAVSLLLMVYSVRNMPLGPFYWISALYFLGLVVHYFTWPYRLERKRFKRILNYLDGRITPTYIRFGERIDVEDSDSTFNLEYRKIEKVFVLKHGLILRYAEKAHMAIDPNCFTKGTYEEFKVFLREKRPDLSIPD